MTYEEFIESEYKIYKTNTNDPMEFDDFVAGCNYLKDLFNQLQGVA